MVFSIWRLLRDLIFKENLLRLDKSPKQTLLRDFIAAITVSVMIIPQAMAYAVLGGFPPIYGLYACLVPLLLYPLLGTSPYLSVGPVALVSILLAGGLGLFEQPFSAEYVQLGLLVAILAGLFQCMLALFKLGSLVNFLSHPVLSGFTSAAALIIITSQTSTLLGIKVERSSSIIDMIDRLISSISGLDLMSSVIGVTSLFLILCLKKIRKSFPAALLVVVAMSVLVYFLKLESVRVVGSIPSGLPSFINPITLDTTTIIKVLPLSIVIGLVSFVESMAISKSLGSKHGIYKYDSNRELWALGISKIGGAFFQSIPNTGSFGRSAINESSGAKTGWSSIFASVIIGVSLLLFTKVFSYIPYPVLAALVISAVLKLIDIKEIRHLFSHDKSDFWELSITLLLTLFLGVKVGIISGIILSIIMLLQAVATPHIAVLGKIDDSGIYRNVKRFEQAEVYDDVLIIRYDSDIFFGNAQHFFDTIESELSIRKEVRYLVLDLTSVTQIDSTGIRKFNQLIESLHDHDISIHFAGAKGPLRDRLNDEGLILKVGRDNQHMTIDRAMEEMRS